MVKISTSSLMRRWWSWLLIFSNASLLLAPHEEDASSAVAKTVREVIPPVPVWVLQQYEQVPV